MDHGDPLVTALAALASVTFTAIWLLAGRSAMVRAGPGGRQLEIALLATAAAAATTALSRPVPTALVLARAAALLEPLAWTVALAGWARSSTAGRDPWPPVARRLSGLLVAVAILAAALELPGPRFGHLLHAALALAGLSALVALLRRLDEEGFWKLKYLLAAVGAVLLVHLAAAARALGALAGGADGLEAGRMLVTVLAAPLVLVALGRLDEAALAPLPGRTMAAGALLAAAVTVYGAAVGWLAYEIHEAFPNAGPGLALAGGTAAVLALALALASGQVRALLDRLVGRLTGERFDYEREWLRFIDTVGACEAEEGLPLRVIRAVAEAVDATGGALWVRTEDDRFELLAIRNIDRPARATVEAPGLAAVLAAADGPIELDRLAALVAGGPWPDWLPRPRRGWLVLPLPHRGQLSGFMVLAEPRAGRRLSPQERRLLRILAREAASYLAEELATRALAEARQFAAFSRKLAFLTHDLKNVAAELQLAAANARRHLDDPTFRADLVASLDEAVERLYELLARLRSERPAEPEGVDLVRLLAEARGSRPHRRPAFRSPLASLPVRVEEERLLAALRDLIDNAFEATGEKGPVELLLRREGRAAIVEVRDGGPGLPAMLDVGAARPFVTTKPTGLGLGLAAARETVASLGGRLEIESRPGRGTTARIVLPEAVGEP